MDADKVLALAIEAGFSHACWTDKGMKHWRGTRTDLNRFADLIEQAKEKQMIAEGWRSPEQVEDQPNMDTREVIEYAKRMGLPTKFPL